MLPFHSAASGRSRKIFEREDNLSWLKTIRSYRGWCTLFKISLKCYLLQQRLKTSGGVFDKLVQSCERLASVRAGESLPVSEYHSLVDLRANGKPRLNIKAKEHAPRNGGDEHRHSYHGGAPIQSQVSVRMSSLSICNLSMTLFD